MKRHQQSRHALGSDVVLTLVLPDDAVETVVFDELWREIETFEQRFSRFRPDSELSQFNAAAGSKELISQPFRELLLAAKAMSKHTNGLYNPCVLPALQRAGYKGSWPAPHKASAQLVYDDRKVVDWQEIEIGETWASIPKNAAIDFGGIGKGYLLDQLGKTLEQKRIESYWLSLGGDILCNGHEANGDSWYIGIAHAVNTNQPVATAKNNGHKISIATSGVTKRQGVSEAGQWHHLIDPRTSKPSRTDVLTATACADNAVTADIAAKCLVLEPDKVPLEITDYILQRAHNTNVTTEKTGDIWG